MNGPAEQFKINLNQNLWGLVVSFGALGTAEHYNLRTLFCFSVVTSGIMVLSVIATTSAYTINYVKNKIRARRFVLIWAAALALLMILAPPWETRDEGHRFVGYRLLFRPGIYTRIPSDALAPPLVTPSGIDLANVPDQYPLLSWPILVTQLLGLAIVSGALGLTGAFCARENER